MKAFLDCSWALFVAFYTCNNISSNILSIVHAVCGSWASCYVVIV